MFGGEVGVFGGEASPLPPPLDRTLGKSNGKNGPQSNAEEYQSVVARMQINNQ